MRPHPNPLPEGEGVIMKKTLYMDGFSKYHFKDIGANEQIVRVLHRNWFYLLQQFLPIFVVIGLYFAGLSYGPKFFPELFSREFQPMVAFMENFFMLAVWIYGFLIWVDYYFDIWIITTERIVNIEQRGMFTRKVSELRYSKIQDVTAEIMGFIPTVLNFGDVRIQTAGEKTEFVFRTISDPNHIKNIILEIQKKTESNSMKDIGEIIKDKMSGK
jgi:uncharacterized membrane protein YdbT with pleckstrin-like domain